MIRIASALSCALLLAACGDRSGPAQEAEDSASEVLEGSISDAMIPYGHLRSQPPLEEPAPGERGRTGTAPASAGEGAQNGEADAATTDAEAEPAAGENTGEAAEAG